MRDDIFWQLIQESIDKSNGELDSQHKVLISILSKYEPEEIIEFDKIFNKFYVESYTSDLWAAAYIINGGCYEDDFDYFRGWLISRGKKVYEETINNPDALVDVVSVYDAGNVEFEDFLYIASDAYKVRTSQDDFYNKAIRISSPKINLTWSENEEELGKMFPELVEKFW